MFSRDVQFTEQQESATGFGGTIRNLSIGIAAGIFAGATAFVSEAVFSYADTLAVLF